LARVDEMGVLPTGSPPSMVAPPRPSPAFQAIASRQGILGKRREEERKEHALAAGFAGPGPSNQSWLLFATQLVGNAAQEVGAVGRDLADFGWSLQSEIREAASTPPDLAWPPLDCGETPVDGCTHEEHELCEVARTISSLRSNLSLGDTSSNSPPESPCSLPESSRSLPEIPGYQEDGPFMGEVAQPY